MSLIASAKRRISHKWMIVLAFLLGGSISSLAQDPSDFAFFYAQAHGLTSPTQETLFWYWVPFALYFGFFIVGFVLAKARLVRPIFMIYFLTVVFVISAFYSLTLPQTSSQIYIASVILGTFVSLGILLGLRKQVK